MKGSTRVKTKNCRVLTGKVWLWWILASAWVQLDIALPSSNNGLVEVDGDVTSIYLLLLLPALAFISRFLDSSLARFCAALAFGEKDHPSHPSA